VTILIKSKTAKILIISLLENKDFIPKESLIFKKVIGIKR